MTGYDKVRDDYEKWLRDQYANAPAFITRPDFKQAAIRHAEICQKMDKQLLEVMK